MKATIRRFGNSRGIILPKPLLSQLKFENEVDLEVERGALVLRRPRKRVRDGWAEASKRLAAVSESRLIWPEFSNRGDAKLKW